MSLRDRQRADTARQVSGAWLTSVAAALAGVAISTYLTIEHYTHATSFACPETATINCLKVTTSKWSVIAGIPVAVLGLAYFVVMTVLVILPSHNPMLRLARLVGAAAGVLMVIYLVYIELFEVNAICLWCTGVHVLTVILFAAVLWRDAPARAPI
jgi:uncharacterized membrane protein